MRKLIYVLIWILLAVMAGLFVHQHPAYLFISLGHISIQTSLWFAFSAWLVAWFLLYKIGKILFGIYHIPIRIADFTKRRGIQKLSTLTQQGLRALMEMDWRKSEICFAKGAKKADYPFFYYIAAAQVAFAQKQLDHAQDYLNKAKLIAKPADQPLLTMMQVHRYLAVQDYQSALTGLLTLKKKDPDHPFVLQGLETVYFALKKWRGLDEILPKLGKQSVVAIKNMSDIYPFHAYDLNATQLAQKISIALLDEARQVKSSETLETVWERLPKKWRKQTALIASYAAYLMAAHQHDKAENLLKKAIKETKDPLLLKAYVNIVSENSAKQIARAEGWLKEDTQNPDLLFCVGALCLKHRLLGKAKDYLQLSIKERPAMETYFLLGEVFEVLQDKAAALDSYKIGSKLALACVEIENLSIVTP